MSLLNAIFGCAHKRTTFPQTRKPRSKGTYIVCLDCGQEFEYDWLRMEADYFANQKLDSERYEGVFEQ